jgi:nucleotide-binding universal stress UspA family protein
MKSKKRKKTVSLKQKIEKILVPIDGSRNSYRALDFAILMAKSFNATISVVFVIDLQTIREYAVLDPISKRLELQGKRLLKKLKTKVTKSRIKFSGKIIHGKTGITIIKLANKEKFDIIVMGARGLGGFSGLLVGSVSNYVIQKSKKPVLIIK